MIAGRCKRSEREKGRGECDIENGQLEEALIRECRWRPVHVSGPETEGVERPLMPRQALVNR